MTELETLARNCDHAIDLVPAFFKAPLKAEFGALAVYASKRDIAIASAITALRASRHTPATNVVDSSSCAAKALEILEAVK